MSESPVNAAQVEKYQLMLEKDPNSLVFAALVDAYRKMGLLEQAVEEGLKGVKKHPKFASGHIALAQVLIERDQLEFAAKQLQQAVQYSSENIKAFQLLAECLVKLKKPKEALKAYKMVLFLNPNHEKAISSVKKLESLTADEYDDEIFEMLPLKNILEEDSPELQPLEDAPSSNEEQVTQLDRAISLIDAFIVRNEFQKALNIIEQTEKYHGQNAEFLKRQKLLHQLTEIEDDKSETPQVNRRTLVRDAKIDTLKTLLARVGDRMSSPTNGI